MTYVLESVCGGVVGVSLFTIEPRLQPWLSYNAGKEQNW